MQSFVDQMLSVVDQLRSFVDQLRSTLEEDNVLSVQYFRALRNDELRVLVSTFCPWNAWFSLDGSSSYACFLVGMR